MFEVTEKIIGANKEQLAVMADAMKDRLFAIAEGIESDER
jgi:hypothetical protein